MRRTLTAAFLLPLILCCAGCPAPGKGPKAEALMKSAEPVVATLRQYHAKRSGYPAALRELVPGNLPENAWRTAEGQPLDDVFSYRRVDQSYELKFTYTGPGINNCLYRPETAKWECFGHY